MKTFRKGGIHPPENKITASSPIVALELPREVTLLMAQNIGAPAVPCVKKGDHVKRGDKVGEAGGFVSAPVHTPITGTVTRVDKAKNAYGYPVDAVTVTATDEEHAADMAADWPDCSDEADALDAAEITRRIGEAGIVGLGGATFPARVKLTPPKGMKADVLIINGAECEPWLTNDDRLMREQPEGIIKGVKLLMKAAGVERALIGIEANKPEAIKAMTLAAEKFAGVEVVPLKTKYPQGGEKQLIEALTGRQVPSGGLPIAVGAIVFNVATAYAVCRAICNNQPLMERVLTVTGPAVKNPGNFLAAIGTPLTTLIEAAGGVPEDTGKVILGGPMMGRTAMTLDTPSIKGTSAILIMPADRSERGEVEPCIRCARCVDVCPMGLEPYLISTLSRLERYDDAEAEHVMDCIECGSCSFTCPSWRPLLDYIRLGKARVGANIRARKQSEK